MSPVGHNNSGFTLLELLAVLVIIALLASQVAPQLGSLAGFRRTQAANAVASALERSRERAIRGAQIVALRPEALTEELPEGLRIVGQTLVFYPNGGSSGGNWVLADRDSALQSYSVDWLTGGVATEHLPAP